MNTPKQTLLHHAGWMTALVLGSATMADAQQTFSNFQAASVVVGQANFTDQATSASQTVTPGPTSVAVSNTGKMAVGDQTAKRVLIWNNIPTSNGVPAAVVVGKPDFTSTATGTTASLIKEAEGVAFSPDGSKLIVCDQQNCRVLIWNSVPTSNGQPADVVVGQTNFTGNAGWLSASGLNFPGGVLVTPGGKLIVTDTFFNRVLIYNSIPTTNGASADVVIGQPNMTSMAGGTGANQFQYPAGCAYSSDGKLLVADATNNRIMVFNSLPTTNGASADAVIGQTAFGVPISGTSASSLAGPLGVAVSQTGQVAIGEFGRSRVLIYDSIPTTNGVAANVVLGQPDFMSGGYFNGGVSDRSMASAYEVAFAPDGRLLVTGRDMARVMIFGSDPTLNPISVTGFNQDVIFENDSSPSVSTEFGNRHFVETGIGGLGVSNYSGLNSTGEYWVTVGSDPVHFDIPDYSGNNVALINDASGSVTLTLTSPTSLDRVAFAHSIGSKGAGTVLTATVNYTDSTTQLLNMSPQDWISAGASNAVPIFNVYRDGGDDGTLSDLDTANGAIWSAFGSTFDVDENKLITSIRFDLSGGVPGQDTGIFAVSGRSSLPPQTVTMDWATVGNINNPNDPADGDAFTSGTQNFGSVGYVYRIGKYEVTIGQYATFLNQVAKSDLYGLWNANMQSDLKIAGIGRSGSDGSYVYSVIGTPNRPVTYVSWFDAARFANWMHNGQGNGSTETGAYTLNGATSGIIPKSTGATVWIPNESEWYKAAYYDPTSGAGAGDNYWAFPYRSNSAGDNTTSANFFDVDYVGSGTASVPTGNALTNVGAYSASASYYGTFDQGGNVCEWIDAVISGSSRTQRGGAWNNYASDMAPSARIPASPTTEYYDQGFRVAASVPVVAQFAVTPASPRPNQAASFDASSSSPVGGIVSYSWNWGDGSPVGTGATPTHSYPTLGTYTVTLTVTDSLGATATKTSTVTVAYPVTIDWVTVGNPGNPVDPATGYGAVGSAYRIGKYEVTNSQYAAFLNNVDSSGANPYSIYHPSMGSDARGGISFNAGAAAGSKYAVKANMGNKPVNYVSWYDAARFVNWLSSGQGSGGTETGSYTMSGGGVIYKNSGANIWIPTENEWYKAAFYDATPGAGGGDNYWSYPTRSNTPPTAATANASGDVTNPGANVANYLYSAVWNGMNGNVTTVGSTTANSYYGTFDQGGNVWEWSDAVIGVSRGTRGGSYDNNETFLVPSYRNSADPWVDSSGLGFRIATTGDVVPPVLSGVHIESNNSTSTAWAKTGDSVTLSFTSDEAIQTPVVTVFATSAAATNTGGNTWTVNVTVGAGTPEGVSAFSITTTDLLGNTATAVTATTDASSVTVDRTAPVPESLTDLVVPATSAAGAVVSFAPTATDNLDASPSVSANPLSGSVFPIGVTTVNVTAADNAGNTANGSFTVTVTNNSNAPHFATAGSVPVSVSGFDATGMSVGAATLGFGPAPGAVLTLIDNTSGNPIAGAFTDLPDGGTKVSGFGGKSYRFIASYSGGDGNDLTLTLQAPEIVVELPVGTDVADGGSKDFGTFVVGTSASLTFTIKNTGPGILNGLTISKSGVNQAMFSVTTSPVALVDGPTGTTVFTLQFTPTTSGAKTATIHIASDDADENPFDITLTGQALSISDDTDGDGLNDAAEFKLADLGYDWQVGQPALVNTLFANSNLAGLYTQGQVQALNVGTPLISRNPATGRFSLKMDWKKSSDLQNFTDFPAQESDVSVNPSGDILFEFTSPDDAAFFRLEAK